MGGTFLKYSAALIGAYLVTAHASDFGNLISSAGTAGSQFASTLQGNSAPTIVKTKAA